MGAGGTRSTDAAEIAPSVSRQRFGTAARCLGVSLALAEGAGSSKRRSAPIHLQDGNHTVRDGGNRAQGSAGSGASLGAICRSTPPRGALPLSGGPPFHSNIDEDHF